MARFIVPAWFAMFSGCPRDKHDPVPLTIDEIATPVERADATPNADWCKQHSVPESRCVSCLARRRSASESIGTCTATCEDAADPRGSGSNPTAPTQSDARALDDGDGDGDAKN